MQKPSNSTDLAVFDRTALRIRRGKASASFNEYNFLKLIHAQNIAERISFFKRRFSTVVDYGSHNGELTDALRQIIPDAQIIALDNSPAFISSCRADLSIVGDEELPPLRANCADAVLSAASLHTLNDLPGALAQIKNILTPDGLFMASFCGGSTLNELRHCLMQAEIELGNGVSPRIFPFISAYQAAALLQRTGFALPVVDTQILDVAYADAFKLMRDLKGMGESNILMKREHAAKSIFPRANEIYQETYPYTEGGITATFEIITMTGWKPHHNQQTPLTPGSAEYSLKSSLT